MNENRESEGAGASELLVVAEASADGDDVCLEWIAESAPPQPSVAIAAEASSPAQCVMDWQRTAGELPENFGFVHVGGRTRSAAARDGAQPAGGDVPTFTAVPSDDVSELLWTLTNYLGQWDDESRKIVYVQPLTTLLERVDAETVFRHLHIFTHRLRAMGAHGYFRIDADEHSEETVRLFRPLFDRTVTLPDPERESASPLAEPETNESRPQSRLGRSLSTIRERLPFSSADESQNGGTGSAVTTDPLPLPEGRDGLQGTLEDPTLFSSEEYVLQLLQHNRGRLRQQEIIERTGWSPSKVSRVLSALEDDGRAEKIRAGRENVVLLGDRNDRD